MGDGIFIELPNEQLQRWSIKRWGDTALRILGPKAINKDKLDAEGEWSDNHIILGLSCDTTSMTVALPESKRAGARVFDAVLLGRDSARIGANAIQKVRGCMERFKSTSATWRLLTSPVVSV